MKYPSVFLTVLIIWLVIDVLAIVINQQPVTLSLYYAAIFLTVALFFIGFWRNK